MERKWDGEINDETEQKRQQGEKEQEQKVAGERHFATFPMVNDCLDKFVQIQLTRKLQGLT